MSSTPSQPSSRRRHPRIVSVGRCFAQMGSGWEASVLNVSPGGMLIRLTRMLTPGSSYFVKLLLGDQVAVVEARVVRLVAQPEGYLAGMEFLRVSGLDREALQSFVEAEARES